MITVLWGNNKRHNFTVIKKNTMQTKTTIIDAMERYFDIQEAKKYAQEENKEAKKLSNIPQGLNYREFYTFFLEAFRSEHPNSTPPKNSIIEMFFDDYVEGGIIPSY